MMDLNNENSVIKKYLEPVRCVLCGKIRGEKFVCEWGWCLCGDCGESHACPKDHSAPLLQTTNDKGDYPPVGEDIRMVVLVEKIPPAGGAQ